MAFNEQEQEIIRAGQEMGKTAPEVRSAIVKYRLGIKNTPRPEAVQEPSAFERAKTDITSAGQRIGGLLTADADYAQGTPGLRAVERGVQATAEAFKAPIQAATEFLPDIARQGLETVGGAFGGVINWLGDKIGSTELAQKFVIENPEAAQALEEVANIGVGGGEIAGSILAAEGAAKTLKKGVAGVKAIPKVAGAVKSEAINLFDRLKGYVSDTAKKSVDKELDNLLKSTSGITKKVSEASKKGTDIKSALADPQVYKGLKVENSKIIPDEALQTIQNRIDSVMDAKKGILPEIDRLVPEVSKKLIRDKAVKSIKGQFLDADEKILISKIDKQMNAQPATLKPSLIDALRAKARKSARDAKGMQKSTSEYAAIENAARDIIFDITDDLPISGAAEYKALNDYVKNMINVKDFLDKSLRGSTVKGGKLGQYVAKGVGAVAGSTVGPYPAISAIVGSKLGGVIADILTNNQLGSSIKLQLIKGLTDDVTIIREAESLLKNVRNLNVPLLETSKSGFRSQQIGTTPIALPKTPQSALDAEFGGRKTLI